MKRYQVRPLTTLAIRREFQHTRVTPSLLAAEDSVGPGDERIVSKFGFGARHIGRGLFIRPPLLVSSKRLKHV